MASDPHLDHKNIPVYRKCVSTTEENNLMFRDNVLDLVGKRDVLWLLGDICFGDSGMEILREIASKIGHINVVLGNHCSESGDKQRIIKQLWNEGTYSQVHSMVKYKRCWLTHAPIHPDELRGKYNIHGHTHSHVIPDDRYYNVCCDQTNMRPVLFNDIWAEFVNRKNRSES